MGLRKINLTVSAKEIGTAVTWAYPEGDRTLYLIPTYQLTVTGKDDAGENRITTFEVIRFGVKQDTPSSKPHVVGLADAQTHTIKAWLPKYTVHSAFSKEDGAWQVYGNFLVHDGPDAPMSTDSAYASVGCIEICGGPAGFLKFNNLLIDLSGSTASTRNQKLAEIGSRGVISITYLPAGKPPLKLYKS